MKMDWSKCVVCKQTIAWDDSPDPTCDDCCRAKYHELRALLRDWMIRYCNQPGPTNYEYNYADLYMRSKRLLEGYQ